VQSDKKILESPVLPRPEALQDMDPTTMKIRRILFPHQKKLVTVEEMKSTAGLGPKTVVEAVVSGKLEAFWTDSGWQYDLCSFTGKAMADIQHGYKRPMLQPTEDLQLTRVWFGHFGVMAEVVGECDEGYQVRYLQEPARPRIGIKPGKLDKVPYNACEFVDRSILHRMRVIHRS